MKKQLIRLAALTVLLFTMLCSLKCGIIEFSWSEIFGGLFSGSRTGVMLRELRLARTLAAVLAGGALALSGTILQKVLHNDLASPDILGISGGAGCAGLTLILLLPQWQMWLIPFAFSGALLAALLVCLAAWKRELAPERLILAGVALGAVFNSISGALLLCNSDKLSGIMEFSLGSFAGCSIAGIGLTMPFFLIIFIAAIFLPRRLDLLSLGRAEGTSMGLPVNRTRIAALSVAALAAATAVSLAGLLGFAGLMAPHIAAKLQNSFRSKDLLWLAPVIGGQLALTGDLLGRTLIAPAELPAGLFLSAAGAVFFLILLWNNRRSSI